MQQKQRNNFEEKHHMHLIESLKKTTTSPSLFEVSQPDRVTNYFNQHSVKRCRITSVSCFFETASRGQTIWQISVENILITDFLGDFSIVINLIKDA